MKAYGALLVIGLFEVGWRGTPWVGQFEASLRQSEAQPSIVCTPGEPFSLHSMVIGIANKSREIRSEILLWRVRSWTEECWELKGFCAIPD